MSKERDIHLGDPDGSDLTEQHSEVETEWRHRWLLALSRLSAALSGLRDLDAILEVGLDNVLNIMNGTIGGILLLDEQTQMLSYRVYRGLSAKYAAEMRMVPLRAKDNTLGVINIASHMPHRFTKDDMYLLHTAGDLLGVAVEQAKVYDELRKGRESYRRLARQTLVAQEEERRRIARELHDETSQSLSGLALYLQALVDTAEKYGNLDHEFKERMKQVHSLAVQVSAEIGRLITELRPTLLDTLGLVPAIRQYAETNLRPLGVNVSLESRGNFAALPSELEVGLFRVAQGAIGNIVKHSQARNTMIELECRADQISLYINDDGVGFSVSELTGIDESGRGGGLFGMKERVGLLGGTCSVKSQPGQGTTVMVWVPLMQGSSNGEDKGTSSR